jgi:hypothetical protein
MEPKTEPELEADLETELETEYDSEGPRMVHGHLLVGVGRFWHRP